MENQFYDQQYLKLCSIADKEVRAFARTALESFADRESLQMFLNSLFYNHSIMESDQFAVYLGLMYEFIGQEMPDDMDCYIVMDQESNIFFSYFLTTLLRTILNQAGGDHPCPAM